MNNQSITSLALVVILMLALVFAVAGCFPPQATPATGSETDVTTATTIEATFLCPDGTSIDTVFDNAADTVTVTLPDGVVTLPHVVSASGARYSDGTTTFWNKGDEATIEISGETVYKGCIAQ